jgi:hypothetical protein
MALTPKENRLLYFIYWGIVFAFVGAIMGKIFHSGGEKAPFAYPLILAPALIVFAVSWKWPTAGFCGGLGFILFGVAVFVTDSHFPKGWMTLASLLSAAGIALIARAARRKK